ncbi:peptidase U32 family protein [Rickettsiales bacterium LUAb2]
MELVCPAGTLSALKEAVKAGADTVYCGFRNETNARNFPGLNFSKEELQEGVEFAHAHGSKVLVALNTYPTAGNIGLWHKAIDDSAELKVNGIIVADLGLLRYAYQNHPSLNRHLSVQAAVSTYQGINYLVDEFKLHRVVLPRVLSFNQIKGVVEKSKAEIEVFVFGGLCTMAEGKCSLSSYITGLSPNKNGVCSPAEHVEYEKQGDKLISKLGGDTINVFNENEEPGYPTICKGRFHTNHSSDSSYLFEEPTSLSIIKHLPELKKAGVSALKVEGRQRGKAYVRTIVSTLKQAIASLENNTDNYDYETVLASLSEGNKGTLGAYNKRWL